MRRRSKTLRVALVLALVAAFAVGGFLGTAAPVRADHDTVPWTFGWYLNSDTLYETYSADTYWNGAFYAVQLQTSITFGTTNITFERCTMSGLTYPLVCGTRIRVNDLSGVNGPVDAGFAPSIAVDHNGYIYVAWVKASGFTGLNLRDVYVSVSTDGGATWAPSVRVNAANDRGQDYGPSIAVTPNGNVWVTYLQTWGANTAITLAVSQNQGSSFVGYYNVTNQGAGIAKRTPSIATDASGRIHLVYYEPDPQIARYVVNYTSSADGQSWTAPTILNTGGYGYIPGIAIEGGSTIHVAWLDSRISPANQYSIRYRSSHDGGATWGPDVPLTVTTSSIFTTTGGRVSLAAFAGTVMVVWDGYDSVAGVWGFGWAVSATDGASWYADRFFTYSDGILQPDITVDGNGTFFAAVTYIYSPTDWDSYAFLWNGPPSAPAIASVTPGTNQLTVSWGAPPQGDVSYYQIFRSSDGSTYTLVGTASVPTTSFTDTGLANGTYWYKIVAVDQTGYASHDSVPVSGTVGPTTQQLIDDLNAQIAALQAQLASSDSNLSAARAQLTSLQQALTNLQNSQTTSNAATAAAIAQLQANLTQLQQKLNDLQAQQATQTMSYANLAFEVIVVVLLVVLLINQMRRPKNPRMMMAQPGQAQSKPPEEDL